MPNQCQTQMRPNNKMATRKRSVIEMQTVQAVSTHNSMGNKHGTEKKHGLPGTFVNPFSTDHRLGSLGRFPRGQCFDSQHKNDTTVPWDVTLAPMRAAAKR